MAIKKSICRRFQTKHSCSGCPQEKHCSKDRRRARAKSKRTSRYRRKKAELGVHS